MKTEYTQDQRGRLVRIVGQILALKSEGLDIKEMMKEINEWVGNE
jgi:hypothetical protein